MTTMSFPARTLPWLLATACALLLGGCQGVLLGNLFVLLVTVGIFFGTLGLGRSSSAATRSAERSETQQPRS